MEINWSIGLCHQLNSMHNGRYSLILSENYMQLVSFLSNYCISSYSFLPWITTLVRKLFKYRRKTNPETIWIFQCFTIWKKNSCCGNYMWKYGNLKAKRCHIFLLNSSELATVALDWGKKRVKSCRSRRTVLQSTVYRTNTGLKLRLFWRVWKGLISKRYFKGGLISE